MKIEGKKKESVNILEISGRLDASSSPELEKCLLSLLDQGEAKFLLDLTQMDYVSSSGLRVLLMTAKRSKAAGGTVVLCGLQDHVQEVFEISGFTAIFSIYPSSDQAFDSF